MKLLLLILGSLVLLAVAVISYNVWHALSEPIVAHPGAYELGRQQLHDQLEAAKKREAQFEQQDWNNMTLLHNLILSHQQRIDKLAGNKEAGEIVAYDHDAMTRIQARINELDAKQRAQLREQLEKQQSAAQPGKPQ
jgi:hypothetical protein